MSLEPCVVVRASVLAVTCALLVAACGGGSASKPAGKTGPYGPRSSPYAMSKCMRANGLTNFPDPSQGSGGVGFPGGVVVSVEGELTVDGVTFSGPALKKASRACRIYLPGGGGPPPAERQRRRRLRCSSPNACEPTACRTSRTLAARAAGPQSRPFADANSPAFKHAGEVCGRGGRIEISGGNIEGP